MKIEFDLCKMFGVEEGQEFYLKDVVHSCDYSKYKIENNTLLLLTPKGNFVRSKNELSWFSENEIEIEIIKKPKEIPVEIREILEHCKALGCDFIACHSVTRYWAGGEGQAEEINFSPNSEFIRWANKNLSFGPKKIDDILAGDF